MKCSINPRLFKISFKSSKILEVVRNKTLAVMAMATPVVIFVVKTTLDNGTRSDQCS